MLVEDAEDEYDTARGQGANIAGSQANHDNFPEEENPKRFKVNFYWSYLGKGGTLRQIKLWSGLLHAPIQ